MNISISRMFICLFVVANVSFALDNTVGSGTVPQSSQKSGLVANPRASQLNQGNLIVTGNITGGKHFRGVVPYQSPMEFRSRQGSSSFRSFYRDTAGAYTYDRQPGVTRPYLLPSRAVTSLGGASQGGLDVPNIKLNKGTGEFVSPLKVQQPSLVTPSTDTQLQYRPLSLKPQELQQAFRVQPSQENLPSELKTTLDKIAPLESRQELKLPSETVEKPILQRQPTESLKRMEQLQPEKRFEEQTPDVFEQMKQKLQKSPEQQQPELPQQLQPAKPKSEPNSIAEPNGITVPVPGVYKSFATMAQTRFNELMKSAEDYMKEGKYYRAADAYTVANIYKPYDPLPLAGKSYALFASGEYMSSSYFLSKAIEAFPEYAEVKVDLLGMIGNKDLFETRIKDLAEWQEKSSSGELQFLLAYIYYQTGRVNDAKDDIELAAEKLPDSPAVQALLKTIQNAIIPK